MLLFPIAIGEYDHLEELPVDAELAEVAEILAEFGARNVPWDVPMTRRRETEIGLRLKEWARADGDAFVHWIGHADHDGTVGLLASPGSEPYDEVIGLGPEQLARAVRSRAQAAAEAFSIVVIDACTSAPYIRQVSAWLDSHLHDGARVLLIGTSGGQARLGAFSRALRSALKSFQAVNEIEVIHLAGELEKAMPGAAVRPLDLRGRTLRRRTPVPAGPLPLEVVDLIAGLPEHVRAHFLPKGKGSDLAEPSWYFEGREEERAAVAAWLRDTPGGLLTVTGKAGSGKSAFLGDLVMQSTPGLRHLLLEHRVIGDDLPADRRPPEGVFDLAVHLTGLSAGDLLDRLADAAGLPGRPTGVPVPEQTRWLAERLTTRRGFTVLADALDEAQAPVAVAADVLRPLAAVPGIRVLVGTRRSTREGPDLPDPADTDLLDALGPGTDLPISRDPRALTAYIRKRLTALLPDASPSSVTAFADLLHDHPSHGFLFAYLAIHEIAADPALLERPAELLTDDHRALFARAVARLRTARPAAEQLLFALACAQGRGLPRLDGIWTDTASALGEHPATWDDAAWLLEHAKPYLMADAEAGQTVFRPAHATFAEHFQQRTSPAVHEKILNRLIHAADQSAAEDLNPYLENHLPAHAAAAVRFPPQHGHLR